MFCGHNKDVSTPRSEHNLYDTERATSVLKFRFTYSPTAYK